MLNMLKMDLYRMFRTKSMYVIWIILAASILLTTALVKMDYEDGMSGADNMTQEQIDEAAIENFNVGITVTLPTHKARSRTSTGLGLAIAKELVDRMNGEIGARIENGEFVVDIRFPIAHN